MLDLVKMKALRERLGLTQEAAAKAAGLSSRHRWADIEGGRYKGVNLATLDKIAKALKCKPADLLK